MAKLFSRSQIETINQAAAKAKEAMSSPPSLSSSTSTNNTELQQLMNAVKEYFGESSECTLVTSKEQLHEYIDLVIQDGIAGLDTETTGLDRINDYIVGVSVYSISVPPFYIPIKHLIPIFDEPYKDQFTYEEVREELQRIVDSKTKLVFANADFDLAMVYKDIKVDFLDNCYFDVLLAWRCLKENEPKNDLKSLYCKYVMKGAADPKKFSDFFTPKLFPYCKPEVAALYAANDAKITLELYEFELPFLTKGNRRCQAHHLEGIADLFWNIEIPMIRVCQIMHRQGTYIDKTLAAKLIKKYQAKMNAEMSKLADMVQDILNTSDYSQVSKSPFKSGKDFNPKSQPQVKYLLCNLMKLSQVEKGGTGKEIIRDINLPITNQILNVRSLGVLISTFVEKLPKATTSDSRIHAQFRSVGADTGRMCIAEGTEITILNGKKKIQDIVPGDLVYCYDDDGMLQLSKVKNLWKTGEQVECVDIQWQSSGSGDIGHLICTPEHNVLKKDGSWCRADSLFRYDKLVHLRRTVPATKDGRPNLYGWNGLSTREQDVVKYSVFGCTDSLHTVVHHVDGDPSNNAITNLELKSLQSHSRDHSKELCKKRKLKFDHLHNPEVVKHRVEVQNAKYRESVIADKDRLLKMIQDAQGRIAKVSMDYSTFLKRCEIAGIDVDSECRKYNPRYHKKKISKEEFLDIYHLFNGLAVRITEHLGISYDKFYSYCKEYEIPLNHMVQSVKPAGKYDVYDIEVENFHNFIASEICVHNSSAEPNLQNIPSHATDIRQMFRATPEMREFVVGEDVDSFEGETAHFEVQRFYLVDTSKGLKYADELTEGDEVTLLCDKESDDFIVIRCEDNKQDPSKVDIMLKEKQRV